MTKSRESKTNTVFYRRAREKRLQDPYLPRKGFVEPTVCPKCNAIYFHKRWIFSKDLLNKIKKDFNLSFVKCPADRKIEDNYPMGIVRMSGSFISEHQEDIVNLLKAEGKRATQENALDRIMKIEKAENGLHVETTTDTLALRIGRVLHRAYKGKSKFNFSYGDKFVTVDWERD